MPDRAQDREQRLPRERRQERPGDERETFAGVVAHLGQAEDQRREIDDRGRVEQRQREELEIGPRDRARHRPALRRVDIDRGRRRARGDEATHGDRDQHDHGHDAQRPLDRRDDPHQRGPERHCDERIDAVGGGGPGPGCERRAQPAADADVEDQDRDRADRDGDRVAGGRAGEEGPDHPAERAAVAIRALPSATATLPSVPSR